MVLENSATFSSASLTAVAKNNLDYFVGSFDGSMQYIRFHNLILQKERNQWLNYHTSKVVDLHISTSEIYPNVTYLSSLEENGRVGIWNMKRTELGPLFVLQFVGGISKILRVEGLFQSDFRNVRIILQRTDQTIVTSLLGDLTPDFSMLSDLCIQANIRDATFRWLKLWQNIRKAKKTPSSLNSSHMNYFAFTLTKLKKSSKNSLSPPLFLKHFYGFDHLSYFQVSISKLSI